MVWLWLLGCWIYGGFFCFTLPLFRSLLAGLMEAFFFLHTRCSPETKRRQLVVYCWLRVGNGVVPCFTEVLQVWVTRPFGWNPAVLPGSGGKGWEVVLAACSQHHITQRCAGFQGPIWISVVALPLTLSIEQLEQNLVYKSRVGKEWINIWASSVGLHPDS